jgi:leucyl aminopeptidase
MPASMTPPFLADPSDSAKALPLQAVTPATLPAWLDAAPPATRAFVAGQNFAGKAHELALLPGPDGVAGALAGLGDAARPGPWAWGGLPMALPPGSIWRLDGVADPAGAVLGFGLGSYAYSQFKSPRREPARLLRPDTNQAAAEVNDAIAAVEATFLVRDLVNHPANLLGPAELAEEVTRLAQAFGAAPRVTQGEGLEAAYPTVAAVGRGSNRAPCVAELRWAGSSDPAAPLVSLVGKGVCFDTGGYDLKPGANMLRMKKDMGGAAIAMGLARMIMAARLPVRLRLLVGAVENSIGAGAMRPLDVIRTRKGITVEIGNTDAEGRLVLCDLLADADSEQPALLLDFATLTGAARVALGPDLPALFTDDDALAADLLRAGVDAHDPLWRLPIWPGYAAWLDSPVADMNNVSSKGTAGAIVAALYLRKFVAETTSWAHVDVYAWNDSSRPGRPEGGEAQVMRACFAALKRRFASA